ncbi:hypothetical protein HPB51_000081 [Rhipicephalus microplus]|uniref:Uncharacterized protein n=1 Tax=Rhipicephalus microplus TaxID=6941 RepID=A0A9J6DRQ6_RHIMP|nr:hypothetical protein HPB51_000081 [Rhipicephalus microplus]
MAAPTSPTDTNPTVLGPSPFVGKRHPSEVISISISLPPFDSDACRIVTRFERSFGPPACTLREELAFQPVFNSIFCESAHHSTPGRAGAQGFLWQVSCAVASSSRERATALILHSRSSGTELLLRSQHRTSSVYNLRMSKITIKVPVGLLVLDVMPVMLVALWPLRKQQVVLNLQCSALTWLMINFSFDNIESKSASGDGFPAVASGLLHRLKALLAFVLRESNKMANRQPGDDYDELDNI